MINVSSGVDNDCDRGVVLLLLMMISHLVQDVLLFTLKIFRDIFFLTNRVSIMVAIPREVYIPQFCHSLADVPRGRKCNTCLHLFKIDHRI